MNKKIVVEVTTVFLLLGCYFQNSTKLSIPQKDIREISFLDVDYSGKNLIYTSGEKSYKDNKGEKLALDFKILSNFKMGNKEYYIAEKNQCVGIVDKSLKNIIAFNYDSLGKINDKYIKGSRDKNSYLIDIETYEMKGAYEDIYSISGGEIIVTIENGKNGYLNANGERVEELDDKNILFFRDKVAITEKNGMFGMYDIDNKVYIPEVNEEIYFADNNILYKRNGVYYYNNERLDIKRVYPTMSDVVIYDLGEGFGLFDLKDGSFSKEPYDEVAPNYDRCVIVGKAGKYGVIDKYTEKGSDYEFDYINKLGRNSFIAGTDEVGLFALVVDDKKITEEKYENFIEISEDYYIGIDKDEYTVIDKEGKIIIKVKEEDLLYYNDKVVIVKEKNKQKFYLLGE